jgi:ankyrin repeat protein
MTYFDKRHAKKFTTISLKSKFQDVWSDFWSKKDKTNIKLVKAAGKGDIKMLQKLLNSLRQAEKIADVDFSDETGYTALHMATMNNKFDSV